jgi:RNA polymerase sigma factor (sigma-70 family)
MPSPSVALLRTQTDERLVALAAAGHERAFEAIVERYRRPLLRHCRRYLPEARAEDALQQALVSAWRALGRGDDVRELRPWLYRIVHNTALNARRSAGYDYEQLRDTLEGGGGPAELAERSAVVRHTLAGLAALPERQRDALLQIAVEGRSQDEVAYELGLSQGAVRQLVHRARSNLRSAATVITPLPLAGWLAAGGHGRGDVVERVAELVAGAGGSATLAKAGAVAVLAGGAVGGPALVERAADDSAPPPRAATVSAPARDDATHVRRPEHTPTAAAPTPTATAAPEARDSGRGRSGDDADDDRSGHRDGGTDDDSSGPGPGPSDDDDDGGGGGGGEDRSGPSDEGADRSGPSGDGGGGGELEPEPESEPVDSSGSGSSGSGSSGSGVLTEPVDSSGPGSGEAETDD